VPKRKHLPARRRKLTRKTAQKPSAQWIERRSGSVLVLQAAPLARLPWLVHGFSTRPGGVSRLDGQRVLNLGFMDWDSRENVLENRRRLQKAVGGEKLQLIPLHQFHSDLIRTLASRPADSCKGDASAAAEPGLLLAVQTADCVPILLVDTRKRVVAAVHAGWRGTVRRSVMKTLGRMQFEYGTKSADVIAAIGPSIGGCCYEVGTEVAAEFLSQFAQAPDWFDELRTGDEPNPLQWLNRMPPGHQPPPKNVLLDLRKANRAQLLDAGLREANISVSDLCTACRRDLLFSYRKEGAETGRLMAVVGIKRK
jgi:purine-nucleoside/S-methyl-5'-thioadenosine phosphorylase / adenosine deaminase